MTGVFVGYTILVMLLSSILIFATLKVGLYIFYILVLYNLDYFICRLGCMGSNLVPNCVKTKDVKSCTFCCYVRCGTIIVRDGGMSQSKTGATYYHMNSQVCNPWFSAIVSMLGPQNLVQRSSLTLLSTVPRGINQRYNYLLVFLYLIIFVSSFPYFKVNLIAFLHLVTI